MKFKPDWDEARDRLTALWNGQRLDRACLSITAPSGKGVPRPVPMNEAARWIDPDCVIPCGLADIENRWWGGESIPSFLVLAGWLVNFGAQPRFTTDSIWFDAVETVDFESPPDFRINWDNPWIRRFEDLLDRMVEAAGWDDFLVGQPCMGPASDVLAAHLGTERYLEAMVLHPEWVETALAQMTAELIAARRKLLKRVESKHAFWYGNAGWMPFWAPTPFCSTQSDVSCMISPDMFERFVVPELMARAHDAGAMWYHLDGRDAKQHLPRLLSLPFLKVIQYVPTPTEPPNGIGQLDLFRTIQRAGRIVHVDVAPDQVSPLMKALDPSLLLLQTRVGSPDEARRILAASRRRYNRIRRSAEF